MSGDTKILISKLPAGQAWVVHEGLNLIELSEHLSAEQRNQALDDIADLWRQSVRGQVAA